MRTTHSNGMSRPPERPGERLAQAVTRWTGSTAAFSVAILAVMVWAVSGPLFGWSDTWQLVMNTTSSIVTFLLVFSSTTSPPLRPRSLQ